MPLLQKMATTSASATNRWVFLRLHNIPQVAKSIGIARMGRLAATAPVNKLVSLTWLLWALRSFRSFTLHYIYNCGAAVGSGQTCENCCLGFSPSESWKTYNLLLSEYGSLSLVLRALPTTYCQSFLLQLKSVLFFNRPGVRSASEVVPLEEVL